MSVLPEQLNRDLEMRVRMGRYWASRPSYLRVIFHESEHRAVEVPSLLLALLEVLGADEGAQSVEQGLIVRALLEIPQAPERRRDLLLYLTVHCDDVFRSGLPEVEGVEFPDPDQLPYRLGMVVDAQVQKAIVIATVPATLLHDEQRRRLFPPRVSPSCLSGVQRSEEPLGEVPGSCLKGLRHRLYGLPPDEDVALGGVVLSRHTSGPLEALAPGEGRRAAPGVDDAQLPVLALVVGGDQGLYRLFGGLASGHKIQAPWAVVEVRHRLRRHRSRPRAGPWHYRADSKKLRLDGDAQSLCFGVEGDDGEGGNHAFHAQCAPSARRDAVEGSRGTLDCTLELRGTVAAHDCKRAM